MQGYGERVLGRLDHRRRLRMEHALAKDRSMLRRSAFEIVILDRGDQPDVGVVEEGLKVRATEGLARLALGGHGLADRRQVDRAEVADEEGVGRAQPDLRRSPGFIVRLRAQNLADGVANGDQAADDAGVLRGDPLRPLAVAHGDGLRLAADDLDERALVDEIAALLDRRPFGGRADPHRRMEGRLRFTHGGLEQVARQAVERLGQKVRERARRREDRLQRIDRPIGARGSRMRPERHFGMLDEVAVDRKRRLAVLGRHGFGKNVPRRAGRRGSRIPLLQEQDVDHDFCSSAVVHCAFGHAHRADQIGHCGDVLARLAIDLVHRPARRYEGGETAWAQPLDRAGDEVIMQGQAQLSGWIVGAHGPVRERRIADCEVVELRQSRLREILVPDAGVRVEEFGDPGGRWVHFDAGQRQLADEGFRAKGEEQARPATWLEDAPAVEAHPAERPPDGADHELRRVVGVLGGPLEVGEVVARDEPFEFDAEILPGGRESVSGAAEDPVGEVGRAERREARQPLLLVRPGMAGFRLDRRHELDRGEIVLCARFPTLGKTAIAGEPVIVCGDGQCSILRRKGRGRVGSGRFE